jgi:hypothetical protein
MGTGFGYARFGEVRRGVAGEAGGCVADLVPLAAVSGSGR